MDMKRVLLFLAAFWGSVTLLHAAPEIVFTDASSFPLYGKAVAETEHLYERLPAGYRDSFRKPLWGLGCNSAGLCIRFRSDSRSIHCRWESLNKKSMTHMADAGTRGVDLYALVDGEWRWVGTGRPNAKKAENEARLVKGMDGTMREYMLYLSLYDGVKSLEIGVEEGAQLRQPVQDLPRRDRKVVMYGTSVLQGGCCSRPGMAYTNIISRRLGREVINLGFSGNALLDYEVAELMTRVEDPGVFVMDNTGNCKLRHIEERTEHFFRILRKAHPDVPVIFVGPTHHPDEIVDLTRRTNTKKKTELLLGIIERLKKSGEKNIFYVPSQMFSGDDGEGSVDGSHFTDLGMTRYADVLTPVITKALKKSK